MARNNEFLPGWRVIAASGVAIAHTGTTSETTLATITIPAGAMGGNGSVRVTSIWSYTNSANNKTLRCRFGGTSVAASVFTTTAAAAIDAIITNRNSASSQTIGLASGQHTATSSANVTTAIDTTKDVAIVLQATLASGSETITLENYLIEVFYQV